MGRASGSSNTPHWMRNNNTTRLQLSSSILADSHSDTPIAGEKIRDY